LARQFPAESPGNSGPALALALSERPFAIGGPRNGQFTGLVAPRCKSQRPKWRLSPWALRYDPE